VAAIETHVKEQKDPESYYLLLDFCTLNQHKLGVHSGETNWDYWTSTLSNLVTAPSGNLLLLVLDNWSKAEMLTRVWYIHLQNP
jgi:hypothetical protein